MIKLLEPDFKFGDERGSLTQLVREGYKQVNVITSKADADRGGHYHKVNREAFYIISGGFDLTVRQESKTEVRHFGAGDMFLIEPMVVHDFHFTEDTVLVSMYDQGVEMGDGKMDIYPG